MKHTPKFAASPLTPEMEVAIAEIVRRVMREELAAIEKPSMKRFVGVKDVIAMLGISRTHLYRLMSRRILKHEKFGGMVKFRIEDVETLIKTGWS